MSIAALGGVSLAAAEAIDNFAPSGKRRKREAASIELPRQERKPQSKSLQKLLGRRKRRS